jgi:putative transposase
MARKRYSNEDVLKFLREIDVHLHDGLDVVSACRKAGYF